MTPSGAAVKLTNVHHGFFHGDKFVRALWDFSLEIQPGQLLLVVGPSGCGKTTILTMVSGLLQPGRGTVTVDGAPVTSPRPVIAYMQVRDALMPWRNVQQNVEFGLEVHGAKPNECREKAAEWIKRVGLKNFARSRVGQLSQGMRQRVAIARTLAQETQMHSYGRTVRSSRRPKSGPTERGIPVPLVGAGSDSHLRDA
ncbi:ABC transporter ATP-binding protein [Blastococcus saxobsidens]|uniref:Putative Taurine-transporting ATPase n=1 Tax=Blastococcus saxobsidens (strain DD2) TaxID=1146883 RepID=H6RNR9_BLASD|nr:ATP-binding cassette domain-containing protein [Blastococcus saxobsidens]CCG05217.1 putative Taurine-transporting ATPase [Blastococcus saxobsidens DD2]